MMNNNIIKNDSNKQNLVIVRIKVFNWSYYYETYWYLILMISLFWMNNIFDNLL